MEAYGNGLSPGLSYNKQGGRVVAREKSLGCDTDCGLDGLECMFWNMAGGFIQNLGFGLPLILSRSYFGVRMCTSSQSHDRIDEKWTILSDMIRGDQLCEALAVEQG